MCLQDPRLAKTKLRGSMTKLRTEMEKSSQLAQDIVDEFNVLVASATEAYLAMTNESSTWPRRERPSKGSVNTDLSIANSAQEAESLKQNAMSVAFEQKFQHTVLQDLETRVSDSKKEFEHARSRFQKDADRGGENLCD